MASLVKSPKGRCLQEGLIVALGDLRSCRRMTSNTKQERSWCFYLSYIYILYTQYEVYDNMSTHGTLVWLTLTWTDTFQLENTLLVVHIEHWIATHLLPYLFLTLNYEFVMRLMCGLTMLFGECYCCDAHLAAVSSHTFDRLKVY